MNEAKARSAIERWFRAALEAADPGNAVRRHLRCGGDAIRIDDFRIGAPRGVTVAAVGKAAVPMAAAVEEVLGPLVAGGFAITKDGHAGDAGLERIAIREARHPIPDERGVAASRDLLAMLGSLGPDDAVLALISGGGSALLESPRPPLTLAEIGATTNLLLRAGAPIQDLNAVRGALSQVKRGGLRRAAGDARFATLLLSDVLGNDPGTIASGPTVYAPISGGAALAVLDRYGLREKVPAAVVALLGSIAAPGDEARFAGDLVRVIADNATAIDAAARSAEADGQRVEVAWRGATGEARERAVAWVEQCARTQAGGVLVGGGELTVRVRGDGVGGRNTEFALAAALELERRGMDDWLVASLATDGQDASTGVAGAIASGRTAAAARAAGVDPENALARNDSLAVFEVTGGVVAPGPTGTNVNDLYFAVRLERG